MRIYGEAHRSKASWISTGGRICAVSGSVSSLDSRRFILGDSHENLVQRFVNSPFGGGIDTHPCGACPLRPTQPSVHWPRLIAASLAWPPRRFASVSFWYAYLSLRPHAFGTLAWRDDTGACEPKAASVAIIVSIYMMARSSFYLTHEPSICRLPFGSCGNTCAGLPRPRTSSRPEADTRAKNLSKRANIETLLFWTAK
jgi:hypothetical protein